MGVIGLETLPINILNHILNLVELEDRIRLGETSKLFLNILTSPICGLGTRQLTVNLSENNKLWQMEENKYASIFNFHSSAGVFELSGGSNKKQKKILQLLACKPVAIRCLKLSQEITEFRLSSITRSVPQLFHLVLRLEHSKPERRPNAKHSPQKASSSTATLRSLKFNRLDSLKTLDISYQSRHREGYPLIWRVFQNVPSKLQTFIWNGPISDCGLPLRKLDAQLEQLEIGEVRLGSDPLYISKFLRFSKHLSNLKFLKISNGHIQSQATLEFEELWTEAPFEKLEEINFECCTGDVFRTLIRIIENSTTLKTVSLSVQGGSLQNGSQNGALQPEHQLQHINRCLRLIQRRKIKLNKFSLLKTHRSSSQSASQLPIESMLLAKEIEFRSLQCWPFTSEWMLAVGELFSPSKFASLRKITIADTPLKSCVETFMTKLALICPNLENLQLLGNVCRNVKSTENGLVNFAKIWATTSAAHHWMKHKQLKRKPSIYSRDIGNPDKLLVKIEYPGWPWSLKKLSGRLGELLGPNAKTKCHINLITKSVHNQTLEDRLEIWNGHKLLVLKIVVECYPQIEL